MQTILNRHDKAMREGVAAYVETIAIPALDERAVVARRGSSAGDRDGARPVLGTFALAAAAVLAMFFAVDASAVVAGMQRFFAAFTVAHGRTLPMNVREVGLARARVDVPFRVIVPPALPGIATTVREIVSPASPESDSVAFELTTHRPRPPISILESRDGGGPRQTYISVSEPGRDDTKAPPLPALQSVLRKLRPQTHTIAVFGDVGKGRFTPQMWVSHGTRIVLMSPPGALSDAQMRAIRAAMTR